MAMEGSTLSLVALLLCLSQVCSLECYYCPFETPSSSCTNTRNCSATDKLCKTKVFSPDITFPFDGSEMVTRDCTDICEQSDNDELGTKHPVFCCSSDLCNNRGLYASRGGPTNTSSGLLLCFMSLALFLFRIKL
ncbi:ly6/PLAUR domain-containing protein 2-like [Spea bombifrons]|uniref:ly6/PLAUR domain-containing protein 2-like n=1 Tax=Spea bombifrons TaxID=233779 RepID=UPI00234B6424|nr:ly6/PLAUR domain-containing protein 2-like [Spea bombifrons]